MSLSQKERNQNFRQKRRENGLCVGCGESLDRDGTYCTKCRKKINAYVRDTREWYITHNICPRCRKNIICGEEKMCPECRAKFTERQAKRRKKVKKEYNKQHAEWARKTTEEWRKEGICYRCGKRKVDYGYKTCSLCREKMRDYKRIRYKGINRESIVTQGLCYRCGEKAKDGYKLCERCYQDNVKNTHCKNAEEKRKEIKKQIDLELRNLGKA